VEREEMKHKFTVVIDVPDEAEKKLDKEWTVGECVVDALTDMYEEVFDMHPNDDGISVISEN
jgi:hypothetical protein